MSAGSIDTLWQDVRYGMRWLRGAPSFTATAVLTLAIGIGANAAVFSVVDAVLLRQLPVERPDELVAVFTSDFSGPAYGATSLLDYQDFRDRTGVFSGLMAYTATRSFTIRGESQAERLTGSLVTGNYFDVLGLRPAVGRLLRPDDDSPDVGHVAVLSYGLWQRLFGGSAGAIDAALTLDGAGLQERVRQRIALIPGVESAAIAAFAPLSRTAARARVALEGYTPLPGEDMEVFFNQISLDYFETLGVPLVRGRTFAGVDARLGTSGIVINETLATRYWPGQDPIGRRIQIGAPSSSSFEVLGVVRDSKYRTVGEDRAPHFYVPLAPPAYRARVTVHVRTRGNPTLLLPALRAEIGNVDGAVPVFDVVTLEEHVAGALAPTRLGSALLGLFALLALLLAVVGLYGVMAYVVAVRTHEIGIRMALGATRGAVLRVVMGDGLRVAGWGTVAGLGGALLVTQPLRTLLYGVNGPDIGVIVVSICLMGLAAVAATYVPTRWLASVNPVDTLRVE